AVLPTIGSKELISWLPTLLGIGPGDTVAIPTVCYPTYEVGARLAGATVVRADSLTALGPAPVKLLWLNSPGNPTGRVLPAAHLRKVVAWARERGTIVVNDECYLPLGWEAAPVSVLSVCDGTYDGVLAVHSLSKRSNLAGDCWSTVDWFAGLGIVVAPGTFYGPAGARHVRIALTATDERVESAARRLAG